MVANGSSLVNNKIRVTQKKNMLIRSEVSSERRCMRSRAAEKSGEVRMVWTVNAQRWDQPGRQDSRVSDEVGKAG